jgi:hypothetical protein
LWTVEDFWACRKPSRLYVFIPAGNTWPASSVNSQLDPVKDASGRKIKATVWLDKHRPEPESSRAARAARAAAPKKERQLIRRRARTAEKIYNLGLKRRANG